MAQDFRNVLKSATGTVVVPVLVAGDYDALIGIRCCNIVATTILVDVYITKIVVATILQHLIPIRCCNIVATTILVI